LQAKWSNFAGSKFKGPESSRRRSTQVPPGTNTSNLGELGLGNVRSHIGQDRLRDVLLGYDEVVTQTLYLTVALTCLTIIGSASVGEKKQR